MPFRTLFKSIIAFGTGLLFLPAFINAQKKDEKLAEQRRLELQLSNSGNTIEKIQNASRLASFHFLYKNMQTGDSLLKLMLDWGIKSGKKEDKFSAYRWSAVAYNNSSNPQKALVQYQLALDYAISERMPNEEVLALSSIGRLYTGTGDIDKSFEYFNRVDLNKEGIHDSTRYNYYYRKGSLYVIQDNMVESFKCLFASKKYAEKLNNPRLIREINIAAGMAFAKIGEFKKAIPCYEISKKYAGNISDSINADLGIARIHSEMKDYSVAENLFEQIIRDAESANIPDIKYQAVLALWDIYYNQKEIKKGAAAGEKYKLTEYYTRIGDYARLYNTKAVYAEIAGNLDSADWYYRKTIAVSYQSPIKTIPAFYNYIYGDYLKRFKRYSDALTPTKTALLKYDSLHSIVMLPNIYQTLDFIYTVLGDYKNAWLARGNYYMYRDSLNNQSKKEDILKEEIAAEEESMAKAEAEEKKATERKHAIQYRVIIFGGILLLVGLLAIGFFHPPKWLVRGLAFVSFIFIFEFIILILDSKLHHWFHGAPLPILLIKVLIACLLVPLHHFTEHKVIHFLQSKKLHRLKTVFKDEIPVKT